MESALTPAPFEPDSLIQRAVAVFRRDRVDQEEMADGTAAGSDEMDVSDEEQTMDVMEEEKRDGSQLHRQERDAEPVGVVLPHTLHAVTTRLVAVMHSNDAVARCLALRYEPVVSLCIPSEGEPCIRAKAVATKGGIVAACPLMLL